EPLSDRCLAVAGRAVEEYLRVRQDCWTNLVQHVVWDDQVVEDFLEPLAVDLVTRRLLPYGGAVGVQRDRDRADVLIHAVALLSDTATLTAESDDIVVADHALD